jgi:hypothetical protein
MFRDPATVADLVPLIQSIPEFKAVHGADIRFKQKGGELPPGTTVGGLPLDTPIDVERGSEWVGTPIECFIHFPNNSVESKVFSASATVAHVRDVIGRQHSLLFDRFLFAPGARKAETDRMVSLPIATLRTRLSDVRPPDLLKHLFADAPSLRLTVQFPPHRRFRKPGKAN